MGKIHIGKPKVVIHVQTTQKINGVKTEQKEVLGKTVGIGQKILVVLMRDPFAAIAKTIYIIDTYKTIFQVYQNIFSKPNAFRN